MTLPSVSSEILYQKLQSLPEKPGVYIFLDSEGMVLYVGKSINLKKRVMGYFRNNKNDHKKIQILGKNIHDIELHITRTELEALILEDSMIKNYLPEYNTRQKEFKEYYYLSITDDTFPAIILHQNPENSDYERSFGPYKNVHFAACVKNLICDTFGIRYCTKKAPIDMCIRGELGQCSAPCRNNITEKEYDKIIIRTLEFLNGKKKEILRIVQQKIKQYSSELQFEKAAEWRDQVKFIIGFCLRQKFSHKFFHKILVIEEGSKPQRTYFFIRGELKKVLFTKPSQESIDKIILRMGKENKLHQKSIELLDRALVVYSWLQRNKKDKDYYFI